MPRIGQLAGMATDGLSLTVHLRASLFVRLADDEAWSARALLVGEFSSSVPLSEADADYFARSSGLYVLWPFARAQLDQLARLAGVDAPQLPLIVRPGRATVKPRVPRA